MWSIIRLTDDKCSTGKFNAKTNELLKNFKELLFQWFRIMLNWLEYVLWKEDTEVYRAQNKNGKA